jgi:glycerol kinase
MPPIAALARPTTRAPPAVRDPLQADQDEEASMPDQTYILGLDEGTTGARTLIFDAKGEIVGQAAREFTQIYPRPGWVEHNPLEILDVQLETLQQALKVENIGLDQVRAIGITNQRETAVVWDRGTGKPIYNAIVWMSRQTADVVEGWAEQGYNDEILQKTGLISDAYFSASKIVWILDHVEGARERAERGELAAGTIDSWLIWHLTGGRHVTEPSNASRTMLYNIHENRWDEELCGKLGVPLEVLPEVLPSDGEFGSAEAKLGVDVPIRGNLGDQQAGLFGQACFTPGQAKNTYGTAGVFCMNSGDEAMIKDGLITSNAWKVREQAAYELEGVVYASGSTIQWLRDGAKMIHFAADSEWYASMAEDTGGVYLVPAFTGLCAPYWDMYARGLIIGITRGTDRTHIIRAGLEAMAYQTKDIVEAVVADGSIQLPELRIDGGAVRNNMLCQFQADILGVPVVRPKVTEATVTGVCYVAGLATGLWSGLDEVAGLWQAERVFEPQMSDDKRQSLYHGWKAAVELSLGWAKKVGEV